MPVACSSASLACRVRLRLRSPAPPRCVHADSPQGGRMRVSRQSSIVIRQCSVAALLAVLLTFGGVAAPHVRGAARPSTDRRVESASACREFARPVAARIDQAARMAQTAARDPGLRAHRTSARDLAGRRTEQRLARRHGRKLGARTVLPRRTRSAGVAPRRRSPEGDREEVRRLDAGSPGEGRLDRSTQEHRLVAEHGDAQGADAVLRGHR